MKKIQINVPEKILDFIQKLVDLNIYASRNEAIREALKAFVENQSKFLSNFNSDILKLNELHRKYTEFNEELKEKLFPAYFAVEKKVI